jgi:hypothetical protein
MEIIQFVRPDAPGKTLDPELNERIEFERDPTNRIRVPEQLRSSDPLVRDTAAALRKRERSEGGVAVGAGCFDTFVSPHQISRAVRILSAFVLACRDRRYEVTCATDGSITTTVVAFREPVKVRLREKIGRSEHVLTSSEQILRERGRGWGIPRYDYRATGLLFFEIDEYGDGQRRRWSDTTKGSRLEDLLNDVMIGIAVFSLSVLRPRRLEHERWRQEQERQHRREAREQERRSHLKELFSAWSTNEECRAFIQAAKGRAIEVWGEIPERSAFSKWLAWAQDLAERQDPFQQFIDAEPGRIRRKRNSWTPTLEEWVWPDSEEDVTG